MQYLAWSGAACSFVNGGKHLDSTSSTMAQPCSIRWEGGCHNIGLQLGVSFRVAPCTPHLMRRGRTARCRAYSGVRNHTGCVGRSRPSSSTFAFSSEKKRYAARVQDNAPFACQESRTAPTVRMQAAWLSLKAAALQQGNIPPHIPSAWACCHTWGRDS